MRQFLAGSVALSLSLTIPLRVAAEEKAIDWEQARKFWSFQVPSKPPRPPVEAVSWVRRELDHFVLHRLEAAGLRPEAEAERATLLRRLSFDLTGLPPTAEEVEAFALSSDPEAYSRAVDDLLGSPRFGERMASMWMTVARYA